MMVTLWPPPKPVKQDSSRVRLLSQEKGSPGGLLRRYCCRVQCCKENRAKASIKYKTRVQQLAKANAKS